MLLGNNSAVSGGSQVPGYFLVGLLIRLHCHPLKYTSETKSRAKSQPPAGPSPPCTQAQIFTPFQKTCSTRAEKEAVLPNIFPLLAI